MEKVIDEKVIKSEEGHQYAVRNNLFETVCEKCISDSIMIVNQLIKDQDKRQSTFSTPFA